jgi:predicted alpha/beta hydrolase
MVVPKHDVSLATDDGTTLQGQHFEPALPNAGGAVTIVASATGVPQSYYARFATFLAEHGRPVLTFDGRGIGRSAPASLRGSKVRFRDWGIHDFPAAIVWARSTYPDRPVHWVGHSYGGFGLALAHNNAHVVRMLGVATMTADLRLVDNKLAAWQFGAMLFVIGPLASRLIGYAPGALFGGTDLPQDVVTEWSQWCRTPGFLFGVADLPEKRFAETLGAAIRLVRMTDDVWVGQRAVEDLLMRFPHVAARDIWTVDPSKDTAGKPVGHLGFFRSEFRDTLWRKALDWLDERPA